MEKTLGELFDEYSLWYVRYKLSQREDYIPKINEYKVVINKKIDYLVDNLELNILVNFLLRANQEYLKGLILIEDNKSDWMENSEELALASLMVYESLKIKETYKTKINEFMRSDI